MYYVRWIALIFVAIFLGFFPLAAHPDGGSFVRGMRLRDRKPV